MRLSVKDFIRWIRCLALLRDAEFYRYLGEKRLKLQSLSAIRRRYPQTKLADEIEWISYVPERLKLADGVSICHGTVMAFGDEFNGYGDITIGRNTWIGQYNNLRACRNGHIIIGDNCLVSQFCTLVASNHSIKRGTLMREQPPDNTRLGIILENDIWLGAGVSVMPGVRVGEGAVIGANSVITKNIPAYDIWAGCPARQIGTRA